MKKLLPILIIVLLFLVTCKKNEILQSTTEDKPLTISIEVDGKQSEEVRIK